MYMPNSGLGATECVIFKRCFQRVEWTQAWEHSPLCARPQGGDRRGYGVPWEVRISRKGTNPGICWGRRVLRATVAGFLVFGEGPGSFRGMTQALGMSRGEAGRQCVYVSVNVSVYVCVHVCVQEYPDSTGGAAADAEQSWASGKARREGSRGQP